MSSRSLDVCPYLFFFLMMGRPPISTLFPYTTLFRSDHTLQPTALVHEAYARLIGDSSPQWQGRAHFLGVAAKAMRRVLVHHARVQNTGTRGGRGAYAGGGRLWERGTLD